MKKIRMAMMTAVSMLCGIMAFGTPVFAMEGITKSNFNYVQYANTYPDVYAAFGYDRDQIYNHYVKYGKAEGRMACMTPTEGLTVQNFNAAQYAKDNPDIAAVVGKSSKALYQNFITVGFSTGRVGHSTDELIEAKLKLYRVIPTITNPGMTDEEKVKAVHDWLCRNIHYGYIRYIGTDEVAADSYTASGPMNYETAVCSGYAEAFKRFMDYMGIDSKYVEGTGYNSLYPNGGSHAWNQVKIDGKWYNMDVTWDDPVNGDSGVVNSYDYYLNNSSEFSNSHVAEKAYADIESIEFED